VSNEILTERLSNMSKDGVDGWRFIESQGYLCSKLYVPTDYDSKKVISEDDINNLKIELNTLKSWNDFDNSQFLFAQAYKTDYR
jgi:hypothetical protein